MFPRIALAIALLSVGCGDDTAANDGGGGAGGTSHGGAPSVGAGPQGGSPAEGGGGASMDPWACVGSVEWGPPEARFLTMNVTLVRATSDEPIQGARARACDAGDIPCVDGTATETSSSQGKVSLEVPSYNTAWGGYFEVAPGPEDDFPLNLGTLVRPVTAASTMIDQPIVEQPFIDSAASGLGVDLDPEMGQLAGVLFDCTHAPSSAMQLAVLDHDVAVGSIGYLAGGVTADPSLDSTDASGRVVALNVPPGLIAIQAIRGDTGEVTGVAHVPVRAGAITTFGFDPTPID